MSFIARHIVSVNHILIDFVATVFVNSILIEFI